MSTQPDRNQLRTELDAAVIQLPTAPRRVPSFASATVGHLSTGISKLSVNPLRFH